MQLVHSSNRLLVAFRTFPPNQFNGPVWPRSRLHEGEEFCTYFAPLLHQECVQKTLPESDYQDDAGRPMLCCVSWVCSLFWTLFRSYFLHPPTYMIELAVHRWWFDRRFHAHKGSLLCSVLGEFSYSLQYWRQSRIEWETISVVTRVIRTRRIEFHAC